MVCETSIYHWQKLSLTDGMRKHVIDLECAAQDCLDSAMMESYRDTREDLDGMIGAISQVSQQVPPPRRSSTQNRTNARTTTLVLVVTRRLQRISHDRWITAKAVGRPHVRSGRRRPQLRMGTT